MSKDKKLSPFILVDQHTKVTSRFKKMVEDVVSKSHKNQFQIEIDGFENQFLVRVKKRPDEKSREMHGILMDELSDNIVDLINCLTFRREDGKEIKFGVWKRNSSSRILR